MKKWLFIVLGVVLLLVVGVVLFRSIFTPDEEVTVELPEPGEPQEVLTEQKERFEKRIEKVTEGIHVAIGYALANVIVIESEEGNIIIDTTECVEAAGEIKEDLEEITDAPTRAIIYTHAHPDHIYGSPVFAEDRAAEFDVYAQEAHYDFFSEQVLLRDVFNTRGMRQFGSKLPEGYVITHGIGPVMRFDHHDVPAYVEPTKLFDEQLSLEIGGRNLLLKHAPGETEDQLLVWMPDEKVLFPGDNYYPAFPNLYTIRGSAPRDVTDWYLSLDMMRDLDADYLVPSHAEPVRGRERIEELLTVYRDSIQYIHDAVVRGMNEGKTRDELAAEIELPPHLAKHPETRELYGQISFSVRSIYDRYLGWFDGNAVNLDPLPEWERADNICEMVGGTEKMLAEAEKALEEQEYQWAAELAQMILHVDSKSERGREIKIEALLKLGEATYNTNARNYYFSQALELAGKIELGQFEISAEAARNVPIDEFFRAMAIQLNPEASADKEISATFNITDTGEVFSLIVRRGVAELKREEIPDADLVVNVEEDAWKELAAGTTSPVAAMALGKIQVEDWRLLTLKEFVDLFEQP